MTPYVGECRLVGFNFAPAGWMICQGQVIAIDQNTTLFQLIGTTYGGNGQTTFNLPDLQGRAPVHQTTGFVVGQVGGSEGVNLTTQQLPVHGHPLLGSSINGTSNNFANAVLAQCPTPVYVANHAPDKAMNGLSVSNTGGSQPHENRQPYLTMTWIISLYGVYPSPT
jgi:microcystin-dependent protein